MMRGLVILLIILLAGVVGAFLSNTPGQVVIDWFGWRVQTSASLLAVGLLLTLIVASRWGRLTRWFGRGARERRQLARHKRGFEAVERGLVALIAEDSKRAGRAADSLQKLGVAGDLAGFIAGQSAMLQGNYEKARESLTPLLEHRETRLLGLRALITVAERSGDTHAAFAHAKEAVAQAPGLRWAQGKLLYHGLQQGAWTEARAALDSSLKAKQLRGPAGGPQRAALHLAEAQDKLQRQDRDGALKAVNAALKEQSDLVPAALLAAQLDHEEDHDRKAERVLKQAWKGSHHPDLAQAWVKLSKNPGAAQRFDRLLDLVGEDSGDVESRLLRARAALDADLVSLARKNLEPALSGQPDARVFLLMADIDAADGRQGAADVWRQRAKDAPAAPGWVCGDCGHHGASWQAVCSNCSGFATFRWQASKAPAGAQAPVPALPAHRDDDASALVPRDADLK